MKSKILTIDDMLNMSSEQIIEMYKKGYILENTDIKSGCKTCTKSLDINTENSNIKTLIPTCPTYVDKGVVKNIIVSLSPANVGTPPYFYEIVIDGGTPIRYPPTGPPTVDVRFSYPYDFNLPVGPHTVLGRIIDSCVTGNKIVENSCTVEVVDCAPLDGHLDIA